MALIKFDTDINLSKNQLKEVVLEKLNNLTIPTERKEGRFAYNTTVKLPLFDDGTGIRYLVTTEYVNAILGGLSWKQHVRLSTAGNVVIATALVTGQSIDDIELAENDRVLVQFQTDKTENGIYIAGAIPERSDDMDSSSDFTNAIVQIDLGTIYSGYTFRCITVDPSIDVDDIEFEDFNPVVPDSTEAIKGKTRYGTLVETIAGSLSTVAVHPAGLKAVTDLIWAILNSVTPAAPEDLSGLNFDIDIYTASQAGTGAVHDCTDDITPDGTIEHFYNGDEGTLSCEVDGIEQGSKVLTTGSDIGTYEYMIITADEDPYPVGEMGYGLYKQLSATIRPTVALSLAIHTYQLKHTLTGNSAVLTFWVDNPTTVTISAITVTLPALTRYVSGVPSLKTNDILLVDFTVNDAVKKHYNTTRLARLQGDQLAASDIEPPVEPPVEDAAVAYTNEQILVLEDVYTEDVQVQILGYNAKSVAGTQSDNNTSSRVDTVSDEALRKTAGSGEFPSSGYDGAWDATQSLKTYYTEELQLLNGQYQWPTGDYTGNLPTAGEDYSTGMGSTDRWVLINPSITLDNTISFVLTLVNTSGTWTGIETSGVEIQIKVEGETGWLDANAAFAITDPVDDGDPCMIYTNSSALVKKVSFGGTPRTGVLLIRIGLPLGSDKKFGHGITITNITSDEPSYVSARYYEFYTGALEAGVLKSIEHMQDMTGYIINARNIADTNNATLAILRKTPGDGNNSIDVKSSIAIAEPGLRIELVGL